ncbi:MAG: dihydroorotate dehydrogenase electron transfer subunit [Bacillota bacterium]
MGAATGGPIRPTPVWHGSVGVLTSESLGETGGGRGGPGSFRRLTLRAPEVAQAARPGQFVHVLCPPGPDPGRAFLRRPLSLHDADPAAETIRLVFRVVGPGTRALAALRSGDELDLIGPLGNGVFPVLGDRPAILAGGGMGLVPLLLLAKRLVREMDRRAVPAPLTLLAGVSGSAELALVELFEVLEGQAEMAVASEEGAPGTVRGLVTDLLETALRRAALRWARRPAVYACGPRPMLAAVQRLVEKAGVPAWLSVEERMACGVGACRGCAVPVRGPARYRLACLDGPVFGAEELDFAETPPGEAEKTPTGSGGERS